MKNKTDAYLGAVQITREASKKKKQEILDRFEKHACTQNTRAPYNKDTIGGMLCAIATNYFGARECEYLYAHACMACKKDIYICGQNCRTCGIWICLECSQAVRGIPVCKECEYTIVHKEYSSRKITEKCPDEILEWYQLIRKYSQAPSQETIQTLASQIKILEKNMHQIYSTPAPGTERSSASCQSEKIKKSIITRIKLLICDLYIHKAKEEKYSALYEQLKYLLKLRKEHPDREDPISLAIDEIILEIAGQKKQKQPLNT